MYCLDPENIENFDKALADNFVGWVCHHRLQTWTSDGERRLVDISAAELKALDMYYNVPAEQLIYLTESEHKSLHSRGEHNPMYGKRAWNKGKHHSEEHINKIAEANRGKHNDKENFYCYECPEGFVIGRLLIK